jgi:threonine synthase
MKPQFFISTRGDKQLRRSAEALIGGLAPDKGLYVPVEFPQFGEDLPQIEELVGKSYSQIAKIILKAFFTDYTDEELEYCVQGAYGGTKFDTPDIAPVHKLEKAYILELSHGRTAAFKDLALSIHPYLIQTAVKKEGEEKKLVILTATSGDTGKAALAGFADVPGTEIFVFYPSEGVSIVQKRQMISQEGANVHVFGTDGNFDEAQTAVKEVFNDENFATEAGEKGFRFTSANSISIGRLFPQVAYYVNAYVSMLASGELEAGECINVSVPTGNFGNILAAYYAKRIGLPIGRLICASNENSVLTDFLQLGVYDLNYQFAPVGGSPESARRRFIVTSSPSMDILISSNLERLLYHLSGNDAKAVANMMRGLDRRGRFAVTDDVHQAITDAGFFGGFADMGKAHPALEKLWKEEHYLLDTHTAVAYAVYLDYVEATGDKTKTLVASTASPYKFAKSIAEVLSLPEKDNEFDYIEEVSEYTGVPVPEPLQGIESRPVLHGDVIGRDDVQKVIEEALGI